MNTQEWVNNIRNTLIAERTAVPGKAGETPVSLLVEELERINSTSPEREAVNRAVELFFKQENRLVSEKNDWLELMNIISAIELKDTGLAYKLFDALKNETFQNDLELRSRLFSLVTELGRRLLPVELFGEEKILHYHPMQWIDACMQSKQFKIGARHIFNCLEDNKISVKDILLRLPFWYQIYDSPKQFEEHINMWLQANIDETDKEILIDISHKYISQEEESIYKQPSIIFCILKYIPRDFMQIEAASTLQSCN